MNCRYCKTPLQNTFIDLISTPASNSYLTETQLNEPEVYYPLKLFVCEECKLVQIDEYKKSDDIFDENYAYFSSFSQSWLNHAKAYVSMIIQRLSLNKESKVIEIASNDGYLLQYFQEANIPNIGVEPTNSTAKVALEKGLEVIEDFFSAHLAQNLEKADLILGNNVLAHVPDLNDFVEGLKIALKPSGTITMEFPHLLNLIKDKQFDTIYHEHYSYLSLFTLIKVFKNQGLTIYDVQEIPTHGGSLRIYAKHAANNKLQTTKNIAKVLQKEEAFGLLNNEIYKAFQDKINVIKYDLINFLLNAKKERKKVIAYGAAAKGNTLLNYCGIKPDLIEFVVDKSPYKQGMYLPGSHIPILDEQELKSSQADYVLILPWNIKDEIIEQLSYVKQWGGKFVIAIPELKVL